MRFTPLTNTLSFPKKMHPAESLLQRQFHQDIRPRVWSLIVTIMGDIVEPMGGEIKLSTLTELCSGLGIDPVALRCALERLNKEGWLAVRRAGRDVCYQFSCDARTRYHIVAASVYAKPCDPPCDWIYTLLPEERAEKATLVSTLQLTQPMILDDKVALWPAAHTEDIAGFLDGRIPLRNTGYVDPKNCRPTSVAPYISVPNCTGILRSIDAIDGDLDPKTACNIRILLLHFWRRLMHRFPSVHAPLPEEIWPMPQVQREIARVYGELTRIAGLPDTPERFAD